MSFGQLLSGGVLLEGFDGLASAWTTADGSLAADTTNVHQGAQSLRLTSGGAGLSPNSVKGFGSTIDMSAYSTFSLDVFCHTDPVTTMASVALYFDIGSSGNAFLASYSGAVLTLGWNRLVFAPSDFTPSGSAAWNAITRMRVRINAAAGQTPSCSFDNLRRDVAGTPCIIFAFDDCYQSAVTEGVAYLQTKSIPATLYVAHDTVGAAGNVTAADLATAAAAGCTIASHGYTHTDPNTQTAAQVEDEFRRNAGYLVSLGYRRGAYHAACPYTIEASATTLTGLRAAGVKTARQSQTRLQTVPVDEFLTIGSGVILNTTTLAAAQTLVDRAIARKQTQLLVFHDLVASPGTSTQWAIADFKALADYVATKVAAGDCVVTTIDRWYDKLRPAARAAKKLCAGVV